LTGFGTKHTTIFKAIITHKDILIEAEIALFLYRFTNLKHAINNSPRNLIWLTNEREGLKELCWDLNSSYLTIADALATKPEKYSFITVPYENQWKDYEFRYASYVSEAAKSLGDIKAKEVVEKIIRGEENFVDEGGSKEEYCDEVSKAFMAAKLFEAFDPIRDNPAQFIEELPNIMGYIILNNKYEELGISEEEYSNRFEKAFGAWNFFIGTVGIDFYAIVRRWRSTPELYILPESVTLHS